MLTDNDTIICAEKVSRMLSQNTRSVVTSAALGLLLLYIQAQQTSIPINHIYLWITILLVISVVRISVGRFYQYHPTTVVEQLELRLNVLRASIIINAACWGANVYLVGNKQSLELLFFCSFIISGITSGAVVSTAIDKICAMAYIVFAIIPLNIYLFSLETPVTLAMASAGTLYVVFMYFNINTLHKHLIDNIVLRIEAEKHDMQIREMAFHDALTGLPNRRLLQDRLDHALEISLRNHTSGAVIFIDLNKFKQLNDSRGHDIGDLLLKEVAKRLRNVVRESDTVARLGGDEFVIIVENLDVKFQNIKVHLNNITEGIIKAFNIPIMLQGEPYIATLSIGASIFGKHGNKSDELIKHADAAMYQAKRGNCRHIVVYEKKYDIQ